MMSSSLRPGKVVLAYSGGLDTTVILKWLQSEYGAEVVTFSADLGQGIELEAARSNARAMGLSDSDIFIEDLRSRFVTDFVFPMFRANALYEGVYQLGTAIARPLIAQRQVQIAHLTGADAVCHGATGKGNDQIRFEMGYYALDPDIRVVAPWREWDFASRSDLLSFASRHGIAVPEDSRGEAPYSVDANLLHTSSEGKVLENPSCEPPLDLYGRTVDPVDAPEEAQIVEIGFVCGDPVSVDGQELEPVALLERLNAIGGRHGVGRLDMVENRLVGMKSRGVYETPGGALLLEARRGVEQITLDRGAAHLKDELMPRYARLVYDGLWFSPERRMLQAAIDASQEHVTGTARLRVYKGAAHLIGRHSQRHGLYSQEHVTFEDDGGVYDPGDATGFSRIVSLRLRMLAARDRRLGRNKDQATD